MATVGFCDCCVLEVSVREETKERKLEKARTTPTKYPINSLKEIEENKENWVWTHAVFLE